MIVFLSIITALLIVNTLVIALLLLFFRGIMQGFKDFITPPDDKTASGLGNFVSAISDTISRSLVAQAKATFMGKQSGESRAEAAVEGDIAEGMASQNPLLGAALSSFPALKKTLRRNPMLVDFALQKLGSMMVGNGNARQTGTDGKSQFKFNL